MSSSTNTSNVLVVGAGPAGLILALSLLEQGVPTRIIDKETSHRVGAKGAGIMPRSQEVYKYLGLWPDIEKVAHLTPPMRLYSSPEGLKPLKTWHLCELNDPTPANPFMNPLMLGQSALEAIIRRRLQERHGVVVELGTELISFEQTEEHVVAHLRKKSINRVQEVNEEAIHVSYLVGADGGKSGVRKTLGLSFLGETREEDWLIYGDVEVKGIDSDHWHFWRTGVDNRSVLVRPPDGGDADTWGFIGTASGMDETTVKAIGSDPTLAENFFYDVSGRRDVEFGKWVYLTAHRANIRMTDTFQKDRVFLSGDAGHAHSPAGGQGLNSSIQDSFNLAWKLALVVKGFSNPSLLKTYTEERLPVIAEMLQRTTKLLELSLSSEKNTVPDTSDENSGWRRGRALYQLGINYRWSSIVVDERSSKPTVAEGAYGAVSAGGMGLLRAGDRAPDAPGLEVKTPKSSGPEQTRLFDLLDATRHTVLIFAPGSEDISATIAPIMDVVKDQPTGTTQAIVILPSEAVLQSSLYGVDAVVVDKDGHARDAYTSSDATSALCIIVRPDGVIGGIVASAKGVVQYFSGIFSQT